MASRTLASRPVGSLIASASYAVNARASVGAFRVVCPSRQQQARCPLSLEGTCGCTIPAPRLHPSLGISISATRRAKGGLTSSASAPRGVGAFPAPRLPLAMAARLKVTCLWSTALTTFRVC